jgi:hypothetical protein
LKKPTLKENNIQETETPKLELRQYTLTPYQGIQIKKTQEKIESLKQDISSS